MKMFVYGTLKRNHRGESLMGDSTYIRDAKIKGKMVNMGGFPAVTDGEGEIYGEVWEVSNPRTLEVLDRYEGHPDFYCRTKTMTVDGEEVEYYKNLFGHHNKPVIESGKWD